MRTLEYTVPPQEAGRRLDYVLRAHFELSEHRLRSLKFADCILLDGVPAHVGRAVAAGQTVMVQLRDEGAALAPYDLPLRVPYRDADILIVDKPAPLPSIASARQDSATLENAHARMQRMLHTGQYVREYLAVTQGAPQADAGVIDRPIGHAEGVRRCIDPSGKRAVTHYAVLERAANGRALLRLRLETGRTHQIRVHLQSLGCPIAGDYLYGAPLPQLPGRFALHAARMQLTHPMTGETLTFESPLPEALAALLKE